MKLGAGGLSPDPIEAAQMFMELAKLGHPQAQVTGCCCHCTHIIISIDKKSSNNTTQISTLCNLTISALT